MSAAQAIPILPARSLDESVRFYETLGFECPFRQETPDGYAIVRHPGGLEVHLFAHTGIDAATNYAGCYWRVPDADAVHESARTSGITPPSAPTDRPWGMREFHLVDPSGNLVRVGHRIAEL